MAIDITRYQLFTVTLHKCLDLLLAIDLAVNASRPQRRLRDSACPADIKYMTNTDRLLRDYVSQVS